MPPSLSQNLYAVAMKRVLSGSSIARLVAKMSYKKKINEIHYMYHFRLRDYGFENPVGVNLPCFPFLLISMNFRLSVSLENNFLSNRAA